jgi:transcriptional repressor NrdR
MNELRKLDPVAYVRFASVYREFKDVEQFLEELGPLMNHGDQGNHGPGHGPGHGTGHGEGAPEKPSKANR